MIIEGEKDDLTGRGQTVAALDLTPNLSAEKKELSVKNPELVDMIGLSGLANDLFSQDCAATVVDSLRFPLPLWPGI